MWFWDFIMRRDIGCARDFSNLPRLFQNLYCSCLIYTLSSLRAWIRADFCIDHLVMSMCRVISCGSKRVFAMTSAFSSQNSVSLCRTSFCMPRPNLPVTAGISWLPTFAFQSSVMKRMSLVLVLEVFYFCFFGISSWEHRLRLLWCWMVCLGKELRSFCHF